MNLNILTGRLFKISSNFSIEEALAITLWEVELRKHLLQKYIKGLNQLGFFFREIMYMAIHGQVLYLPCNGQLT